MNKGNGLKNILYASVFVFIQSITPKLFNGYAGHSWIQIAPYLLPAQFFGEYIYSFVMALIALELNTYIAYKKPNKINLSFILFFILFSILFPVRNIGPHKLLNARIVQGNISSEDKIVSEGKNATKKDEVISTYEILSNEGLKENTDLIIWPETAYPEKVHPYIDGKNNLLLPKRMKDFLNSTKKNLVYGSYIPNFQSNNFDFFNSVIHSNYNSNNRIYHKNILMPFGEKIPFMDSLSPSIKKKVQQTIGNYSTSSKLVRFNLFNQENQPISFITPICYEILSTTYINELLKSSNDGYVDLIINLSNDSGYGKTSDPEQHFLLSKWRALENNMHLIRSTNSGISSIISPGGEELIRTNIFETKVFDYQLKLPKNNKATFYYKYQSIPIVFLILLLFYFESSSLGTPIKR